MNHMCLVDGDRDHMRTNNSIGLAETKRPVEEVPVIKANRFANIARTNTLVLAPDHGISSPRSLSGLQPAKLGERQSPVKFSVCHQPLAMRGTDGSLQDEMGGLEVDDDEVSLMADDDSAEVAWRKRKKKLEHLVKPSQKRPELHGPAGLSHIHVQ